MIKTLDYGYRALVLAWRANGFYAVFAVFCTLFDSTIYPFVQVYLLAQFLDLLGQGKTIGFQDVSWIIIVYLLASLLKLSLRSFLDVKEAYLQMHMDSYLDMQISKKLTELDPATFESSEFQNLIAQLEGVKGSLQRHLERFVGLIDAVFKFVTASVVISFVFPLFIPLIILATIPSYIAWDKFREKTWIYYIEKRSVLTRITQYIKNLLSADSTSKESTIMQTGPALLNKVSKEQSTYFTGFAKANDPWIIHILGGRVLQFAAFAYSQYLNLSRVFQGTLGIGQFTLIFQQSLTMTLSAEEILNVYSSLSARNKYLEKYFEFMATQPKIVSPEHPIAFAKAPHPPVIQFKNVGFKYPESERYILKNFNLTIASGEKIALVGENGAGKTTLIKLLLRFYDVTDGEILINDVNIRDVDLKVWHTYIGALFQDFIKYQFSFKENIYLGDLAKGDNIELLKKAIERSGAEAYLEDLPKGLNQQLGKMFDEGVDLSGGQWQKLALARTFFRDAPLLILDEPTSAIDAKAEYEIFQKVQNLQKDKTVLIISHRFSTVRNADRILVLDEGKIIEEGTHKDLMKKKGLYAELFEIQAQGYK